MVRVSACAVWLGVLLAACGGRTETGPGGDDSPSDVGTPETGGKTSKDPDPAPPGGPTFEGDTELGDCVLGFPPWNPAGRSCTWLADDLCYEERQMACNCTCPRDRDSQCSSGFEGGPDARVEVFCQ